MIFERVRLARKNKKLMSSTLQSQPDSQISRLLLKIQNRSKTTSLLVKGSSWSLITCVSGAGLFFIAHLFLARLMGPKSYGDYFYALTVINLLALTCRLGLDTATLKFIPIYNVNSEWSLMRGFLNRVYQVTFITSILCACVTGVVIFFVRETIGSELAMSFWVACLILPVTVGLQILSAGLRALKRIFLSHSPQEVIRPISLVCIASISIVLFGLPAKAHMVMIMEFVSIAVALIVSIYFFIRSLPKKVLEVKAQYQTREWFRTSIPLTLMSGLLLILKQSDVIMVGAIVGTTQAGIYGIASRVAMLLGFGLNAANSITAPMISELHAQNKTRELQRMVSISSSGVLVFSILAGTLMIVSGEFLLSLFGSTFVSGYLVLVILLAGQFINAFAGPTGFLMTMTGHQKQAAQIVSVSVVMNILLNFLLIPYWGMSGAAVSTALAIAFWNIAMLVYIRRTLNIDTTAISLMRSTA